MKGRCLCGSVSYECADPQLLMHCYCKDCQRATGAAYAPIYLISADEFDLNGELGGYTVTGTNGAHIERMFCKVCGSQIASRAIEMPSVVFLKAGGLEEFPPMAPSIVCWTDSAPDWATFPDNVPQFSKNPPIGT